MPTDQMPESEWLRSTIKRVLEGVTLSDPAGRMDEAVVRSYVETKLRFALISSFQNVACCRACGTIVDRDNRNILHP